MMQNNEAMHPHRLFANEEWGLRGMPHVEQCQIVKFPGNIHKQEQTNSAEQSNCDFLFIVKLMQAVAMLKCVSLFCATPPIKFD